MSLLSLGNPACQQGSSGCAGGYWVWLPNYDSLRFLRRFLRVVVTDSHASDLDHTWVEPHAGQTSSDTRLSRSKVIRSACAPVATSTSLIGHLIIIIEVILQGPKKKPVALSLRGSGGASRHAAR